MQYRTVALIVGVLASSGATAQEIGGVGLGVGYGLLTGPTLDINYAFNEYVQARANMSSGMDYSHSDTVDAWKYQGKLQDGQKRLALDWHPFGGNFFLSAGYAFNDMSVNANSNTARTGEVVSIGGQQFTVDGEAYLDGKLNWDNAPTVSLGWGNSPAKGFGFLVEAGVIFTGAANMKLDGHGTVRDANGNRFDFSSNDPYLAGLVDTERDKVRKELAKVDFLPILQLGVNYRF